MHGKLQAIAGGLVTLSVRFPVAMGHEHIMCSVHSYTVLVELAR